jgi:anti-anti-sigma factor
MKYTTSKIGSITLIEFANRLTSDEDLDAFKRAIREMLGAGRRQFIFDVRQTLHVDSSGLATLIEVWSEIKRQHGTLVLAVSPSSKMDEVLNTTKLKSLFSVSDSLDDAKTRISTQ